MMKTLLEEPVVTKIPPPPTVSAPTSREDSCPVPCFSEIDGPPPQEEPGQYGAFLCCCDLR